MHELSCSACKPTLTATALELAAKWLWQLLHAEAAAPGGEGRIGAQECLTHC